MKRPLLLVLAILLVISLPSLRGGKEVVGEKKTEIAQAVLITPQEAKNLIQNDNIFLLDVHTPQQPHIPGTDAFIPYDKIGENLDKLPQDKSAPILVYCRSGSMSKVASDELAKLGYQMVYDLDGGINAYREVAANIEITPTERNIGQVIYGEVAQTSFTLTNFTPSSLIITRVSTSCGCTKAKVVKNKLEPYESTEVEASFDPAVHKDDTDLGELVRTIYIETDNPNFAKVTAEIKAVVIKKQTDK